MRNTPLYKIGFIILSLLYPAFTAHSQTLIMNEVSNGPAGNQEYVEFVVVSNSAPYNCGSTTPPCIDIRGWIFDDNSGYHGASGVATGAVRFSQNALWSCVPLGTIIVIYNNGDPNPAMPPDDLSLSDGNCRIVAPLNSTLFESNSTTPGAIACSYPPTGWTSGGSWNNTLLANAGDCARIVNLAGCEVFSVCWASDNQNNLIYFSSGGSGSQNVWYFNGGNPTVQSNWSEGSTSPSPGLQTPGAPNNAANAAYIAQFNNGCVPITPINVTATSVNAGCTCNGSATATATGSIPGYTYTWYNAAFAPIGQTTATASGLCAGTYHVIGISSIGCSDTATVTITSSGGAPTVSVNSQSICVGASATLTATPSPGGGTYSWSPGGQTTPSISVNPASTTTYTVTYTLAGCSGTGTGTVTVNPFPAVTVNAQTICAGQSATLTANGAASYSWSTGSSANPLIISPAATTSYTVTGTTGTCSNTAVSTVTVNALPTVTVNSPAICNGATANLTAGGASSYSWTTGATSTGTNTADAAPSSTTSYTVTGNSAGCTNTAVSTVTVNALPVILVNSPNICPGTTANLTAVGASSYAWSAGATSTGANTADANPAVTTSYTVTGTTSGCSGTVVSTVTVAPALTITVNSPTICNGAIAGLTAGGASSYSWSTGATSTGTTTADASPSTTTTYTVTGTTGACSGTAVSTVTVNPLPTVTVNSPTICNGAIASLTAGGASSYSWSTGATSTGINTADASPSTTTSYTVTGNSAGCSNTAVSTVTVTPLPTITVNSPTICPGTTATLTAGGGSSYTWSAGATSTGVNTADANPAATISYTVTGTASGCSNTAVSTVTVAPVLNVTVNSPTICNGATATLTAGGASSYTWSTGATSTGTTTADASPVSTTSYTVTGTTGACSGTTVATVTVNPLPAVTVNSPTICNGATANLTGGGAASYSWSAGATSTGTNTADASPSTTTSYTVTGNSAGCTNTVVSTVTVTPLPTITINSPTICPGTVASLTAGGGSSYTWSAGATSTGLNTADANPAATTSYTVTGTASGCSNTAVSTVTVAPVLNVTVNSPTICNGATATLTAGGATSYTWSTGATSTGTTTADASPVSTTSYTVTGTTGTCSETAVATVTVNPLPAVTVNSPTICNGATANLTAGGAASYSWSAGATSTGTNTADASPSITTSYTVTGNSAGCTSTAVSTVTVTPLPLVTVNSPNICPGTTATLTAGGAGSYTWSAGATSTGTNTADVSPAATTSYTVTGTSAGCSNTAVSTVTINNVIPVNAGADDSICFGGNASLMVTPNGPGFSYSWMPVASLSNPAIFNPVAAPSITTTYTVSVTDAGGCITSDSVTIYADPQITLALAGIAANCNGAADGQAIVIPSGGSGSYSYLWSGGCTAAACNEAAGTYTVTVTDGWGCSATGTSAISEPTAVTASATHVNLTCFGVCNGTATVTASGGTPHTDGSYNYLWNTVPAQNTQTATGLCAGTYTCIVSDANGCTPVAEITVTIAQPTALSISPIPNVGICTSGSTVLNANVTGGTGAYTYSWSPPAGLSNVAIANPTASPAGTTLYSVTVTDSNSCTTTANVTVTVNSLLSVMTAGTTSVCPGTSATISAVASNGTGGPYSYQWVPATGLNDDTLASPSATPLVTTTYTVTVNDGCSTAVTSTVTITALPLPVPLFRSDTTSGCAPLCVSFTNLSGGTVVSSNWDFGDATTDTTTNPRHCFLNAGSFPVSLTVTSDLGCTAILGMNNYITVFPQPEAAFTSDATEADIYNSTISFINQSDNSSVWLWNFGDSTASTSFSPAHDYLNSGVYNVMLIAETDHGCIDSVAHEITINGAFTFFAPNAFTPNDDNKNNYFLPRGTGWDPDKYELMIFDRWGNKCFYTTDMNKGWDGKANKGGEIAQMEVYVWKVRLSDIFGKKHNYMGTVTIVK